MPDFILTLLCAGCDFPLEEIIEHTKKASTDMDADPIYRADIAIFLCELMYRNKNFIQVGLANPPEFGYTINVEDKTKRSLNSFIFY